MSSNGRFWALSTIGFTAQGTHFAVIVLIPLLLTSQFGTSTIEVGLWMLPGALAIAAFGLAGGQLLERLGARFLLVARALTKATGVLVFHDAGAAWQAVGSRSPSCADGKASQMPVTPGSTDQPRPTATPCSSWSPT